MHVPMYAKLLYTSAYAWMHMYVFHVLQYIFANAHACSHIHEHTERDAHMQHACMYYNIIIAIMYLFYTLDNIFHYNESSTMPITESLNIFGELIDAGFQHDKLLPKNLMFSCKPTYIIV